MESLIITYSSRNTAAKNHLDALSKINGVRFYNSGAILSPDEIKRVEKSKKSGTFPASVLTV
jgi:hypothetical protein